MICLISSIFVIAIVAFGAVVMQVVGEIEDKITYGEKKDIELAMTRLSSLERVVCLSMVGKTKHGNFSSRA